MKTSDSGELVLQAAAGDQRAWEALVDRHTAMLWAVARGYRLDEQSAADAVQTTWLRLVEHLDRLENPAHVGAWLVTTLRHECLRMIRRGQRETAAPHEDLDRVDTHSPPIDAALLAEERDVALWAAFRTLSERCQLLLRVLTAEPRPSYAEVASALDMPIGSIGPTRERCLKRLRDALGGGADGE